MSQTVEICIDLREQEPETPRHPHVYECTHIHIHIHTRCTHAPNHTHLLGVGHADLLGHLGLVVRDLRGSKKKCVCVRVTMGICASVSWCVCMCVGVPACVCCRSRVDAWEEGKAVRQQGE